MNDREDSEKILKQQKELKAKADKEKAQQEKDQAQKGMAKKAKPTCSICGRYLFDSPRCPGSHGGGGGGGGSGEGGGKEDSKQSLQVPAQSTSIADTPTRAEFVGYRSESLSAGTTASSPVLESIAVFNPDVLAKLLATNVLSIKNDRDNAEFSVEIDHNKWCELLYTNPEYRNEMQGFVKRLLQEFEEFKNQLDPSDKKKCICSVKYDPQEENNILSFNIRILDPSLKLYDTFILQLTDAIKNLGKDKPSVDLIAALLQDKSKVSNDNKEKAKLGFRQFTDNNENQHTPDIQQDNKVSTKRKTPLSTKPMPKGAKKIDDM
jgi:hypothetical protein